MLRSRNLLLCTVLALVAAACILPRTAQAQASVFTRGDVNGDKRVDIADPIFLLSYIFSGGKAPACKPIANANGDTRLDISDAITILAYLFSNPVPLAPLSEAEIDECKNAEPPPPPTTLRHGTFQDVLDPPHGIVGSKVEQLSDGSIRFPSFYYDALGFPDVVVLLTKEAFSNDGIVISGTLLRDTPYVGESLVFHLPPGVTSDQFDYANIWCNYCPLHYAIARLYDGPLP